MANFELIVVALSLTEGDTSLIAFASLLSKLGAAKEVHFVHVTDLGVLKAKTRQTLRDKVANEFAGTARTECEVLDGALTDRLLAYVTEAQADLILIGSKKHVLGARLAMVAPCSVAVIPQGQPARLSHIMVAIDFSDAAREMLRWVTQLAESDRSMRFTALHVMTHESADLFATQESEPEQAETMRKLLANADRNGVEMSQRLANVSRSGEVSRFHLFTPASIQGADVAQTILSEAEAIGADCIAMSTRGRSASVSILLGSVTEKVIERAKVPLLVCKHSGASPGLAEVLLESVGVRGAVHAGIKTN